MADVILTASRAGPTAHVAIESEKRRAIPDLFEAVFMQIASLELRGLEEGAGIHFTFGTDAAGGGRGPAHIKPGKLIAEGVKVKE